MRETQFAIMWIVIAVQAIAICGLFVRSLVHGQAVGEFWKFSYKYTSKIDYLYSKPEVYADQFEQVRKALAEVITHDVSKRWLITWPMNGVVPKLMLDTPQPVPFAVDAEKQPAREEASQ